MDEVSRTDRISVRRLEESGSVHSSSSGSGSMYFESDSREDEGMEIGNGRDSSSNSQLRRFVVTDSFSNE